MTATKKRAKKSGELFSTFNGKSEHVLIAQGARSPSTGSGQVRPYGQTP
jgi:hypothetical protein